jgi:hypothetical protein
MSPGVLSSLVWSCRCANSRSCCYSVWYCISPSACVSQYRDFDEQRCQQQEVDALDEQHGIYYSVLFVPEACVQGQQLLLAAHSSGYIRCVSLSMHLLLWSPLWQLTRHTPVAPQTHRLASHQHSVGGAQTAAGLCAQPVASTLRSSLPPGHPPTRWAAAAVLLRMDACTDTELVTIMRAQCITPPQRVRHAVEPFMCCLAAGTCLRFIAPLCVPSCSWLAGDRWR